MQRKPIPLWGILIIIVFATASAFWFFGGQNYLAHKADIDYSLFHHAEDETNPLSWLGLFVQSGACAACLGLMISSVAVFVWNGLTKKNLQQNEPHI
jgi:hypothetical protein